MGLLPVICICCCLLLAGCTTLGASRLVEVEVTPADGFSSTDTVHIVGTFNQWTLEGENAVQMRWQKGKLYASIAMGQDNILFNLVKNKNWSHMAATPTGKSLCGFILEAAKKPGKFSLDLKGWTGEGSQLPVKKTTTGDIQRLAEFDMPQLHRKADIYVYLPPGYSTEQTQNYPVLYMLDGQNLFDESKAYSNEWQVDEHLQDLILTKQLPGLIVVAVPNGPQRWSEYNPWDFISPQGGLVTGKGNLTVDFIKYELKPYIDAHYRTRPDADFTGLAGSSLGGMMAIYAAMSHGDTFGFVGAFSPSLAVKNQQGENVLLTALTQQSTVMQSRIYVDMGKVEYSGYQDVERLFRLLVNNSADPQQLKLVKDDLGRHCEKDWSRRFPAAISWMLAD